ncbi:MAG: class I SAM-dependent methyltransferase [Omnitrophica WOR_2 bacterium]
MDQPTADRLLEINNQFYQTFALQFSATRQRLQPGVKRILATLPLEGALLDLGCGNGELARELARRNFRGAYFGIDASPGLLAEAQRHSIQEFSAIFLQADLAAPGWEAALPRRVFNTVTAFAVLHHLPGKALRLGVLKPVRRLLSTEGRFIHSEWQFLNSPRLAARILPWERAGLTAEQVDPGDYLLDWKGGGYGLRYVHSFTEQELLDLAVEAGFHILETFYSDGEGGRLSAYQIWQASN